MASIVPRPGDVRSFWLQEALSADPGAACPPLRERLSADVCIVGGGFAGLWTAQELLDRDPGLRIVLVEADICGGGASGRNGGFVSSSWHDLDGLCHLYDPEPGVRYAQALADQVAEVGSWCQTHAVDAWFHLEGVAMLETNPDQRGAHRTALEASRSRGLDVIRPLDREAAGRIARSPVVEGGMLVPDCAIVQPARLARGLRRIALERGVRIHEGTPTLGIEGDGRPVVRTPHGAVRAESVVLTIGAWATGRKGFRTRLANIADYVVVTEPIPDRLEEIGWTSNVGIADFREMLYYLRPTEDRRLAIGGGTTAALFGGKIGRGATRLRSVAEESARGLRYLFPALEDVAITHAWGGPIDVTPSWTPFFTTLRPGVHSGLGFSGHGLAATKLGGKTLASMALGRDDEWTRLPVVGDAVGRFPPEPLRWPLVRSTVLGMFRHDRAADEGRRPAAPWRMLDHAPSVYRELFRQRR
ncbi:MAG: FAD-dependent oxidoreductase [Actinomycetota bacterium]